MLEILSSNTESYKIGTLIELEEAWGLPMAISIRKSLFVSDSIALEKIDISILDEEKSKSFLGAAGMGLVGSVLLGPLGLVAGAIAGGNTNTGIFLLSFSYNSEDVKLVVKAKNKREVSLLKEKSILQKVV